MIYILIRHGESEQNIGNANGMIDPNIPLTDYGLNQADKLGQYIYMNRKELGIDNSSILFFSPYMRTQETKNKILEKNNYITFCNEEILLTEIQCGDFTGYTMKQYSELNPMEYEKFMLYKKNMSRFWYKYPNGESPFDVSIRANSFLQKVSICNSTVVIVSHFHVLKVLQMLLMSENLEWYEHESGKSNCEMRIIENGQLLQSIQFNL